jgi:hypothetical protein
LWLLLNLQRHGNGLRGCYGMPVYLVGSALQDGNPYPRDWDIRLHLPDSAFEAKYGPVSSWLQQGASGQWNRTRWRWSDDCVKQSQAIAADTELNIDFQVMPWCHRETYRGKPRMRLDTRWAMYQRNP